MIPRQSHYPDSYFGPDNASGYVIGRFYRNPGGGVSFASEGFLLWGDAQNALQRSVPPETALQKGLVRSQAYDEGRPDEVMLAMDFVKLCTDATEQYPVFSRTLESTTFEQIITPELYPKQQATLDMACNVLGVYFDDFVKHMKSDDEESDGEENHVARS